MIIGAGRRGGMMILGFLMTGWTSLRARGLVSFFFGYGVCLSRIVERWLAHMPYLVSQLALRQEQAAEGVGLH